MKKSLSLVISGDFLSRGITAFTGLVLIRTMEIPQFAIYVLIAGTASMIVGALTSAFGTVFIVGHAEMKLQERGLEFLVIQLLLALALALVALFFSDFFSGLAWLVGILLVFGVAAEFVRNFERQRLDFAAFAAFNLARTVLFLVAVATLAIFLPDQLTAINVCIAQSAAAALTSFHLVKWFKKKIKLEVIAEIIKLIWKDQLSFFLYVLVMAGLSQIDIILLKLWSNESQIATFGSAFRYYSLVVAILAGVNSVLLPHLPSITNADDMRRIIGNASKVLIAGIPLVGICAALAPWLLPLVDKGKFPDSIPTFQILCISASISLALSPYANILFVRKKFRLLLVTVVLGLICNLVLNSILIPSYGAIGAALTISIIGGAMNIFFFVRARQAIGEIQCAR